jgi:hypothetical protein
MLRTISILIFFIGLQTPIWAQTVGTPYIFAAASGDKIRAALSTNRTAYDNAAPTTLVAITSTEYSAILASLSGAALKGIDNFNSPAGLGTINDMVAAGPNFSILPTNSFIAAVAFSTYNNCTGAIAVTCAASQAATPICLTGNSASLSWTANVVKYFAVKAPSVNSGSNTLLGRISSSGSVNSAGKATGSVRYNQTAPATCGTIMTTTLAWSPCLQVIATTTKQW